MNTFEKSIIVNEKLEKVFEFFNRPENLPKLMPAFMTFKILTPKPLVMEKGSIFDYEIKIFGIPQRWTTYISEYNPPYSFSDIQLKGPHSYWHHQHIFEDLGNQTKVIDKVHYKMPFGPLGKCIDFLVFKHINELLFKARRDNIKPFFDVIS